MYALRPLGGIERTAIGGVFLEQTQQAFAINEPDGLPPDRLTAALREIAPGCKDGALGIIPAAQNPIQRTHFVNGQCGAWIVFALDYDRLSS